MKVLFVYRYLTLGGVETVLRARLDKLTKFGINATAWFFRDGPGRSIFAGLEDSYLVGDLVDLRRFLERERHHFLVVIDSPEVFSILEVLSFDPKLIVEVHSPYPENRLYLRDLDAESVTAFFAPTMYQGEIIRAELQGKPRIHILPNPVHGSFLTPLNDTTHAPTVPILGWIGRLDNLKNWEALVEVAAELKRRDREIDVWLVGRGGNAYKESRLVRVAAKRGILRMTRWFRDMPHVHMPRLYDVVRASAGMVLSTSKGESFGMAIAEAMARACATVVPDQPPFDEFVDEGGSGTFYEPESIIGAADRIQWLMDNPRLSKKLGEGARNAIFEHHHPETAAKAMAELFFELYE